MAEVWTYPKYILLYITKGVLLFGIPKILNSEIDFVSGPIQVILSSVRPLPNKRKISQNWNKIPSNSWHGKDTEDIVEIPNI